MDINLSISPAPTIINKLAVVIYKASAPNTAYASQEFDQPHTNPRNITFANVPAETFIVNTYETAGLPSLGTLRHSFIYDPSFTSVQIKATEFLYMTAGQTGYTDANWAGWEIDTIERVGVGTQYEGAGKDVRYYVPGNGYRDDGFDLVQVGDQFSHNEKFVIRFKNKITTGVIQSAKVFTGTEIITSDTVIDTSYLGKLILVQGSSAVINLDISAISILGDAELLAIVSNGGSHKSCRIKSLLNNDVFQHNGATVDEIILGQSESIEIVTDTANGLIIRNASATILQAGQFVWAYDTDNEPNVVHANGQVLSRATYRRLWLAVQNLPAGLLVSDSTWNDTTGGANNKGKFSTGNGSTTFRVPQFYSAGFIEAVDGSTRVQGTFKDWQIGDHQHEESIGTLPTPLFGRGNTARNIGFYNESGPGFIPDLTSKPVNSDGDEMILASGQKGRPQSIGSLILIRS